MKTGSSIISGSKLDLGVSKATRIGYEDQFRFASLHQVHDPMAETIARVEQEWMVKLEEAKKEAAEKAYKQGFADGEKLSRANVENHLENFRNAMKDVDTRITGLIHEVKPGFTDLIFDLAEKVMEIPVESDMLRSKVAQEIEGLLQQLETTSRIRLQVSPEDYEHIFAMIGETSHSERLSVQQSDELRPGEYHMDTDQEKVVKDFKEILRDYRQQLSSADWGGT